MEKLEWSVYQRMIKVQECLFVLTQYTNVTDGRTDGHRTTERTALAINRAAKIDRSTVTLRDALPK